MDAVIHKFWWKPKGENKHFLTPMAWNSLCWSRKEGGLGFRSILEFNQALLLKLAWWVL